MQGGKRFKNNVFQDLFVSENKPFMCLSQSFPSPIELSQSEFVFVVPLSEFEC